MPKFRAWVRPTMITIEAASKSDAVRLVQSGKFQLTVWKVRKVNTRRIYTEAKTAPIDPPKSVPTAEQILRRIIYGEEAKIFEAIEDGKAFFEQQDQPKDYEI